MKANFTIVLALFVLCSVFGQEPASYWKKSGTPKLKSQPVQIKTMPVEYKVYSLDLESLKGILKNAPMESTSDRLKSAMIIFIPNSSGDLLEFKVVEAPVLDPALGARYPMIKSYAGICVDEPSTTVRFDITPAGFHGLIFSDKGSEYIDPVENGDYLVYAKSAVGAPEQHFECLLDITQSEYHPESSLKSADDGQLRKFRLALACTGEYAQYFLDGSESNDTERKAKVLAAMNTTMTRVNGVFEKDFNLRLIIISNNDAIIYLNPATDPWTTEFNSKTQQTIDNVIGNANYDIGHLVMRGENNGNAGCIGCVCTTGSKGSGFTSHTDPLDDPFDIDYVAHEMGHQLGANHTFTFSNEGTIAQMEPGSASTIMGYAGITGQYDVQAHSDDYFHAISIQQVTAYIKSAPCAQASPTGNTTPTAYAGADYTIPKSTPFELTGEGTDSDAGDVLTFCWEQFDNRTSQSSAIPKSTTKTGPVFRSYKPVTSKVRPFPNLATILSGSTANKWEVIPSIARTLNFRLTVRDNHPGGGSNAYDDMKVTVSSGSGPFTVTQPNTSVSWTGGSAQTITWNVASTTASPVSCANVTVLLSTDGGQTFPEVLLASTPNDGTQSVIIPNIPGTQNRIKVKAVNNIFFDISNADFTITEGNVTPVPVTGVSVTPISLNLSVGQTYALVATVIPVDATNKTVSWSTSNSTVASVGPSGIVTALAVGSATITVTTQDGNKTATCGVTVTPLSCAIPSGLAASGITSSGFTLTWNSVSGAVSYDVNVNGNITNTTSNTINISGLSPNTTYQVQVRTNCASGTSDYSTAIPVTTGAITYCSASGNNVTYEWIAQVVLGSINNSTAANGGYGNFTNLSATVSRGSSQTISLKAGFRSSTYTENWKVWIDYNMDGDFTDSGEEIVSGSTSGSTLASASFTVPSTATLGSTRMRVEMRYNSTPSPCGTFTYGEVEDYTIIITASGRGVSYPLPENALTMNKDMSVTNVTVHPNPVKDKLYINIPEDASVITSIKVVDIKGTQLTLPYNEEDQSIIVNKLANGVYLITIETDRGLFRMNFLKE